MPAIDTRFNVGIFAAACLQLVLYGCESGETTGETSSLGEAKSVVSAALEAWQSADWMTMYETLSSADKESQPFDAFKEERIRLSRARQLTGFQIGEVSSTDDASYVVDVELQFEEDYNSGFRSDIQPRITNTSTTWTVVRENGSYKVTFTAEATE